MTIAGAHAYPRDFARLVRQRWTDVVRVERAGLNGDAPQALGLPHPDVLERLLSVCYQASLLQEEGRPVTFRVALAAPEAFSSMEGPPAGLHRLVLSQYRPLEEHELQRLAAAAKFHRSLIGVQLDAQGDLAVWGLIHSGPRWLQAVRGGRRVEQSIPDVLMTAVTGPGRVLVSKGARSLAALAGGTLTGVATDVFAAPWLASFFGGLHRAQWAEHATPTQPVSAPKLLDPVFACQLAQHVLRRIVSTIRGARHGGMLIFLPADGARELLANARHLAVKYGFSDDEQRRRIFSLTIQIMNHLASGQVQPTLEGLATVGWSEYEASTDSRLAALDEALFEVAHLIAMLADVDGAVVMTDQLELLGFGAEISGALAEVLSVHRSLDVAGEERITERADRVGTRHRSAYRLCQSIHGALVIVVSQDGGVRFVRWQDGAVTYFDQIATGPWEV